MAKKRGHNLDLLNERAPRQFGGTLLKGNAKKARPLSTRLAVHLVLKSERAHGTKSFLSARNVKKIDAVVRGQAKVFGVRIYHFVNVGNHLHLVLRLPLGSHRASRQYFFSFIRAVTGIIARHVLGAERSRGKNLRFWQARPFTRLVSWGRDFNFVSRYMEKNRSEARAANALVDWGFGHNDPQKIATLNTS